MRVNRGFSLLELVVVLAIMGLLGSVVIPRLTALYQSVTLAYTRDDILSQLGGLGYWAFQQRYGFELSVYPLPMTDASSAVKPPLILPSGWQLRADPPIIFRANGACSGGVVYLHYQEQQWAVKLSAPFCQAVFP